jgi:transposase
MDATTVAIDLAKDVFQIAESQAGGQISRRRRLTRRQFVAFLDALPPATTVVMEACGTAHHWGRRLRARGLEVRLLPPQYVRPYVRRDKTDRTDADALLEANRCAEIHPVPVKTVEQQAIQSLHRVRQQWQTTRTARINVARALLREYGFTFPAGTRTIQRRIATLLADRPGELPVILRTALEHVLEELRALETMVHAIDRQLMAVAETNEIATRLMQIPGIGVITATALVGSVPHMHAFRRGRQFASWVGLTPRESSSGLRRTIGPIAKRGNTYLRALIVHGARAALRAAEWRATRSAGQLSRLQRWAVETSKRRGRNRTTVALANKLARIIWAVWTRYRICGRVGRRTDNDKGDSPSANAQRHAITANRSDRHRIRPRKPLALRSTSRDRPSVRGCP